MRTDDPWSSPLTDEIGIGSASLRQPLPLSSSGQLGFADGPQADTSGFTPERPSGSDRMNE